VFHEKVDEVFVVVGTAKDLRLKPRRSAGGFVHVYRVENSQLTLVHKTPLDDVPTALCPFQGLLLFLLLFYFRYYIFCPLHTKTLTNFYFYFFTGRLLVGVGKVLRIYDMGKKKLLRKCENKNFPNILSAIHTQGDRIICADVQESFHFVKYKRSENSLYVSLSEKRREGKKNAEVDIFLYYSN
jgi:splicing factor 3B subunit 3